MLFPSCLLEKVATSTYKNFGCRQKQVVLIFFQFHRHNGVLKSFCLQPMTKHPNVLVNAWCYALYEMRACLALRLFLLSRCRRIVEELGGNPHVLLFFEKYSKVYRDPGSWEPKPFHLNPKNERTTPCNGLDDAEFYASSSSAGDN